MNKHIELSVEINPTWSEYVSDILINQVGCSGVITEETEYKNEEIIKSSTNIKGYLWYNEDSPPNIENIQNILDTNKANLIFSGIAAENLGSWKIQTKEIADEEWAHSWKKFWHPQKIGSKIVICPSWEECVIKDGEIKIELDPGIAFGTGTHPTTKLCIVALEKYVKPDCTIADVGTGSGILAIAGAKLGASRVIGVDNDPSVIGVAAENAEINNVNDKCTFYEGSANDIKEKFDIVVANILAHILIEMMPDLNSLMNNSGKLILSGIISEKAEDVRQSAIKSGLKILETYEESDWIAIIAEK